MNPAFEGPESERWIQPLCTFLAARGHVNADRLENVLGFLPALDVRLGALALVRGYISARDMYQILRLGQEREGLFGELAVELGMLSPAQIEELLSLQQSPLQLFLQALSLAELLPGERMHEVLGEFMREHRIQGPSDLQLESRAASISRRDLHPREQQLFRTLEKISSIATLPGVVQRVLRLLDAPSATWKEVSQVIQADPGLSVQLLRVANSTAAASTRKVETVDDGLQRLGLRAVRQVVLTSAILHQWSGPHLDQAREIWLHSLRTAAWSRVLDSDRKGDPRATSDAFLPALLHDIGRLVLVQAFPSESERIEALVTGDASREQAEREVLGTTHSDVGAYLCRFWSLPDAVSEAVLYHVTPSAILGRQPTLRATTLCTHAACMLARLPEHAKPEQIAEAIPELSLQFHGLDVETVAGHLPQVRDWTAELLGVFS
jgi:HD-like signal output (HDOD) protein